jgi:two-component system sensor histidine kinase and response regulator WspE
MKMPFAPDPELVIIFQADAQKLASILEQLLEEVKASPSAEGIDGIVRVLRELKSASTFLGLDQLLIFCRDLEARLPLSSNEALLPETLIMIARGVPLLQKLAAVSVGDFPQRYPALLQELQKPIPGKVPETVPETASGKVSETVSGKMPETILEPGSKISVVPGQEVLLAPKPTAPTSTLPESSILSELSPPPPDSATLHDQATLPEPLRLPKRSLTLPELPATQPELPIHPELPASSVDQLMIELFHIEVENQSCVLENGLVKVETQPTADLLEPLLRAAHSLKGAARIVGFSALVGLAHIMEELLSGALKGIFRLGAEHIDLLLAGNDIFSDISRQPEEKLAEWVFSQTEVIGEVTGQLRKTAALLLTGSHEPHPVSSVSGKGGMSGDGEMGEVTPESSRLPGAEGKSDPGRKAASRPDRDRSAEIGFIRIQADRFNRLMGIAGECVVQSKSVDPLAKKLLTLKNHNRRLSSAIEAALTVAQGENASPLLQTRLAELIHQNNDVRDRLNAQIEQVDLFSRRLESVADRLYREMVSGRMRPFGEGVSGFPRMIRDVARGLQKKVNFVVKGASTQVDRDILERLESPLIHLVRNSLDHGLETPQERVAAGKKPEGEITIHALHHSGLLKILVSDDGRGINDGAIKQKILDRKLVTKEMLASLSAQEIREFLFLPGFSTRDSVSELSGRGVGLDIVQNMVQEVRGDIRIDSTPGRGTTFVLHLPLTLSVVRVLLFEINAEPYALPLARIDHLFSVSPDEVKHLENRQFISFADEHVGLVSAAQILGVPGTPSPAGRMIGLIISDRTSRYGLVVDRFLGERELVIVPLDARLGKIPNISAGSILENGLPALILDADDVMRSIDNLLKQETFRNLQATEKAAPAPRKKVLVVDDSLTVREVERRLLEKRGYDVKTAVDGMDGWIALQGGGFRLVVTDVDMPRLNGIELVQKIKSDPLLRQVPVMIVSYKDREEDRGRGLKAGADYYLTKSSFHDETLIQAVRDLIGEP